MLIFSIYLIWANLYTICYRYSLHLLAWFQTQSNSQNTVGGCRNIFLALKWSKINFSGIFFLGQFVINWYVRSLSFLPLVSLLPKNVFQNLAFHLEFRHVHSHVNLRARHISRNRQLTRLYNFFGFALALHWFFKISIYHAQTETQHYKCGLFLVNNDTCLYLFVFILL